MTFRDKIKRFFEPIFVFPGEFFWNFLQGITDASYYIFSFEILQRILHVLASGNIENLHKYIYWYIGVSLGIIIFKFLINKHGWAGIALDGMAYYYSLYIEKFVVADGNIVEKIGTGRFISTLKRGLDVWLDDLYNLTQTGIANLVIIFYVTYFVARIHTGFAMVLLVIDICVLLLAIPVNIWIREKRFKRYDEEKEADREMTTAFMSKNELLQNGRLRMIQKNIWYHFGEAKKAQYPVNYAILSLEKLPVVLFLFLRVSIYFYIAHEIHLNDSLKFADLAIFVTVVTLMEKAFSSFFDTLRAAIRHFSSIEGLWSTFDSLTSIKGYDSGSTFSPHNSPIEIRDITYGYNETKVFQNFSLTLEKGKKTALVGASGGGKTTLMKLIAGYLHPESGNISVMGNTLSDTALKTYYPHIGYLTQDPGVFDATIRENLISAISSVSDVSSGGTKDLPLELADSSRARNDKNETLSEKSLEERLISALRLAQCDFVFELEHGLDTEIGERGVRLSGGQKQRLAIAKIFLKNPEIILLDEPTSALDSFSEEKITEALDILFKNRTVIIVAHRLQTVKKADDIIVIEGGEVIERGTHSELVEKGGVYNRMLELQSGF